MTNALDLLIPKQPIYGCSEPRLVTPPLRPLTRDTSYGFEVIDFARDTLLMPLDEWECNAIIHAGELLPDGRPRFRTVLIIVARQNGKTTLAKVLILYWMFKVYVPLVLGLSDQRAHAKKAWLDTIELAKENPNLSEDAIKNIKLQIGEEIWENLLGGGYTFAATNRNAGRSLTVHRILADELREHKTWDAWNAAKNAMNAVKDGQIIAITNQGDKRSVVLNSLRASALKGIEFGEYEDPRLGLIEWSTDDEADPEDLAQLAKANPNLGYRIDSDALIGDARRAKSAGGEELAGFKTEVMCQAVPVLRPAVNANNWKLKCLDYGTMDDLRHQLAMALDMSPDGLHATIAVAGQHPDERVRIEIVEAFEGPGCGDALLRALPGLVRKVKPRTLGWLPGGPVAALLAKLRPREGRTGWPPPGVKISEITSETTSVCMGFAELVTVGKILHSNDPLINGHVLGAEKAPRPGATWVFDRKGGHCDAAYAVACAAHLCRIQPAPMKKRKMIFAE